MYSVITHFDADFVPSLIKIIWSYSSFSTMRQNWVEFGVSVHHIKARQQHDESHPGGAGDLFA